MKTQWLIIHRILLALLRDSLCNERIHLNSGIFIALIHVICTFVSSTLYNPKHYSVIIATTISVVAFLKYSLGVLNKTNYFGVDVEGKTSISQSLHKILTRIFPSLSQIFSFLKIYDRERPAKKKKLSWYIFLHFAFLSFFPVRW